MATDRHTFAANNIEQHLPDEEERRFFAQEAAILTATEALNEAMECLGVTRADLARRLKRTPGFVSQVLSGSRNMTLRTFADLAYALGLQVRRLELSGLGEMRAPREVMNRYLDEVNELGHREGQGSTTRDREELALTSQGTAQVMSWAA